jgi:hypothetical protein
MLRAETSSGRRCPIRGRGTFWTTAALVGVGFAACVTALPPTLPAAPIHRPTIVHDALVPPADLPLTEWPADGEFIVTVQVDPNQAFQWSVFEDYDPTNPTNSLYFRNPSQVQAPPDGGLALVPFVIPSLPQDGLCHRIDFVVSTLVSINGVSLANYIALVHSPGLDGDIATWLYVGPTGCPSYDAGVPLDAADAAEEPAAFDSAAGAP